MEDSRKEGRSRKKKDFHHLIHTWMEEMVKKAIVYNTKKEKKEGEEKGQKNRLKKERKKERERERERENKKVEEIQQQKGRI